MRISKPLAGFAVGVAVLLTGAFAGSAMAAPGKGNPAAPGKGGGGTLNVSPGQAYQLDRSAGPPGKQYGGGGLRTLSTSGPSSPGKSFNTPGNRTRYTAPTEVVP
jgi:hypothetical protein